MDQTQFKVAVIGAGPSGIMAVSELVAIEAYPIVWIDPSFNCGALSLYADLPGNTQIVFEKILINKNSWIKKRGKRQEYLQPLQGLDDHGFTNLGSTCNMLLRLQSEILDEAKTNITKIQSKAITFKQQKDLTWVIETEPSRSVSCHYVFQCIGGKPKDIAQVYPTLFQRYSQLTEIPFIQALCPGQAQFLQLYGENVAVFGRSHSGILMVKELLRLPEAQRPKKVFLFYKGELHEFFKLEGGQMYEDTYYHYFGGIRGETLKWYKENLGSKCPDNVEEVEFSEESANKILSGISHYISAIGFEKIPFGEIILQDGTTVDYNQVDFDWTNQHQLFINKTKPIAGMYAYGLMFPEVWIEGGRELQRPAFSGFQDTIQNTIAKGNLEL